MNIPFSGGVDAVVGFGDRWQIGFIGTWLPGDTYTLEVTSTAGDFTLGVGNLGGLQPTTAFTFSRRIFLGMGSQFNFSDLDDPSNPIPGIVKYEEQDPGAGFEQFLSQFGGQDTLQGFGVFQGRLIVFGSKSIQMWIVDADPSQFSFVQSLDNLGTLAPLSIQSLGDYDVFFLDSSGVRSLRAKETSLNAFSVDIGTPIDKLILEALKGAPGQQKVIVTNQRDDQAQVAGQLWFGPPDPNNSASGAAPPFTFDLDYGQSIEVPPAMWIGQQLSIASMIPGGLSFSGTITIKSNQFGYVFTPSQDLLPFDASSSCGIVDPEHKRYWVFVKDTIYVLSYFRESKITAWSTYLPVDDKGVSFVPQKFVVFNRLVYARTTDGRLIRYGGNDGSTYDKTICRVELPWLDLKRPATYKTAHSVNIAKRGAWAITLGMDPKGGKLTKVYEKGDPVAPDEFRDSSYDEGTVPYNGYGTHFKFAAETSAESDQPATLSSVVLGYKPAGDK